MLLHRLFLNLRCREARRDVADPYQMHATLCRAFCEPEAKCPPGAFLWRLEPESGAEGSARVLVQSGKAPDWSRIHVADWLYGIPEPGIDLSDRLALAGLEAGRRFRFRLRANPSVCKEGKRWGLKTPDAQEKWLERQGVRHGFALPRTSSFDLDGGSRLDVVVSHEKALRANRHGKGEIRLFSVQYDGVLSVTEPAAFKEVLAVGIGHGKALGQGLLSVAPLP